VIHGLNACIEFNLIIDGDVVDDPWIATISSSDLHVTFFQPPDDEIIERHRFTSSELAEDFCKAWFHAARTGGLP
jgi:hypothetical protein